MTASIGRVVVTGGAGFLGSHVCEALIERGVGVVCVDDLSTGSIGNLVEIEHRDDFELVVADVSDGLQMIEDPIDAVLHLASAASPPDYLAHPLETLAVGSEGTRHALTLATKHEARFVLASTSEVYGDPAVHPQTESYWGNVNPIGPRSVYDEAKRFAEALTMAWHRTHGTNVGIARIFNTYGPRLRPTDGRVVSNFLVQAIEGTPLTVYGDGSQTRSLCFVDDTARGLLELLSSEFVGVMNIGNPEEHSVLELADIVLRLTGSGSSIVHAPLPENDPALRCPDITVARTQLGWEPTTSLEEGLRRTADYFRANGIGVSMSKHTAS
jgi:dTDP-glucose 4,6-dehydratase